MVADEDGLRTDSRAAPLWSRSPRSVSVQGTYWVSVQANMDFSSGGQWG